MAQPLMPKATAVWLVENTTLTFTQIAEFCGLHELEVQAIADGEVAGGMQGLDPVASGQLAKEEIAKGQADPNYRLELAKPTIPLPEARTKGARYTPVAKRSDRPDAIAWLLKNHPELADAQITRLVGTTKHTIQAVRDRSHWNTPNIRPQSPVLLGLSTNDELEKAVHRARERLRKAAAESKPAAKAPTEPEAAPTSAEAATAPEAPAAPAAPAAQDAAESASEAPAPESESAPPTSDPPGAAGRSEPLAEVEAPAPAEAEKASS